MAHMQRVKAIAITHVFCSFSFPDLWQMNLFEENKEKNEDGRFFLSFLVNVQCVKREWFHKVITSHSTYTHEIIVLVLDWIETCFPKIWRRM